MRGTPTEEYYLQVTIHRKNGPPQNPVKRK
jgi:hypothetical protein